MFKSTPMNHFSRLAMATAAFACAQLLTQAAVVFDQGPLTGSHSGSWVNQTDNQNFADQVTFSSDTTVDGLNYFTSFDLSVNTGNSDFHLKILSDSGYQPGSVLFSADLGYSNSYTEGGLNGYHFDFAPQLFLAGVTYWVGLSGNGFEAAQQSLLGVAGGDSMMAQFAGSSYTFIMTLVGDQAFQLTGTSGLSVPDGSSSSLLLGVGLLALARFRVARTGSAA